MSVNIDAGISEADRGDSSTQIRTILEIPRPIHEPIHVQARHMFLNDVVVLTPTSNAVSRGHFASLASLLRSAPSNGLQAATDAVALALLSTRFGRCEAYRLAMVQYNLSVRDLQARDLATSLQHSLACVILMSIYEILNADRMHTLECVLHLNGIIALIRTQASMQREPISGIELLIAGTDSQSESNNDSSNTARNSSTSLNRTQFTDLPLNDLVLILPRVSSLFKEAATVLQPQGIAFETQLTKIKDDALTIRSDLLDWYSRQLAVIKPIAVERFTQPYSIIFPNLRQFSCPALRADGYPDQLVASMWNTYRQCQIHLADLICRVNDLLATSSRETRRSRESRRLQGEIDDYVEAIFASIPYMLSGDSIYYCKPEGAIWILPRPPMLTGGLSLQWRLFTIATLQHAPIEKKSHARDILLWFGDNLGIGQAKVLAQMEENPRGGITARGDALSWTGYLV